MKAGGLIVRFRADPFVGTIVLTLVVGFLLGVLAANLRDSAEPVVTGAQVSQAGEEAGGQSRGVGAVDVAFPTGSEEAAGVGAPGVVGESGAGGTGGPGRVSTPTTGDVEVAQSGGAGSSGANVRGVTDSTVKLGIACIDLSVLRNIPQYDAGDQEAQYRSTVEGWRRAGLLPVHGRNIELVFRCFNVLDAADQRAAAVELVRDKQVFAVVAHCCFRDGAEVVAREFRTPLVGVDAVLESSYQRGAPFLFSGRAALEREARNVAHWMREQNLLSKKIGFYYLNDPYQPVMVRVMRAELAKLGNANSVAFSTDSQLGGPSDALAVQRFSAEGVQVVVLMTSAIGFTQSASQQRYKPQYALSDFGIPTITDTTTQPYDHDNFDGALAMTQTRVGEWRLGPMAQPVRECEENYFRLTNKRLTASVNESQWGSLMDACQGMYLAFAALQRAGRNLTPTSFVRALETVSMEGTRLGSTAFSPARHDGGNSFRTVRFGKDCVCWRIQAPTAFRPLYVP